MRYWIIKKFPQHWYEVEMVVNKVLELTIRWGINKYFITPKVSKYLKQLPFYKESWIMRTVYESLIYSHLWDFFIYPVFDAIFPPP